MLQAGLLGAAALFVGTYGWDDGAITLAFSRTFAETGRIALTPLSNVVEGFSSVSWFLLNALVALGRPSFDHAILASQLLSAATMVGSGVAMDHLGRAMGLSPVARWGALGTLVVMGPFFSETVNGMEMGLLTWTALVIVRRLYHPGARASDRHASRLVLGAALAVFVATRFEAAFYVAFLLAPLLRERRYREFVRWGAFAAAVFLVIAAARWMVFGALLPNTIYAKMNPPYHVEGAAALVSSLTASVEVLSMFVPAAALLLILGVAARVRGGGRRAGWLAAREWSLVAPVAGGVAFALITGTNWGYPGRMQLFTIPFLLLLLFRAGDALAPSSRPLQLALAIALASLTAWPSRVGFPMPTLRIARARSIGVTPEAFAETGRTVDDLRIALGQPTLTFMTPDIGGVGLCCPNLRVVDLALLTDVRLAHQGYGALPTVLGTERPEVIEAHVPWSEVSGLYGAEAFRSGYRPAMIAGTRLWLRADVADRVLAMGRAEEGSTSGNHRYANFTGTSDDDAFGSAGSVVWVR